MLNPSCAIYGARGKKQSKSVACFIRTRQAESYGLMTFHVPTTNARVTVSFLFFFLSLNDPRFWTERLLHVGEGKGQE